MPRYTLTIDGHKYQISSETEMSEHDLSEAAENISKAHPSAAASKTNQSNISPQALRDKQGGLARTTIGPPHPQAEPNLFQKALGGLGHVLGLPSGALAAGAMQPVAGHSLSDVLHSGGRKLSPGAEKMDAASVAALKKMNILQRANALSGQSLADPNLGRPIAQGMERDISRAQFGAGDVPMRMVGQMTTDPLMWLAGPATKALPKAARPITPAVFATQSAAGSVEALQRYGKTKDPADFTEAVLNAGVAALAGLHAHSQAMEGRGTPKAADAPPDTAEGKTLRRKPNYKPREDPLAKREREKARTAKKEGTTKPAQPTNPPAVANMPPEKTAAPTVKSEPTAAKTKAKAQTPKPEVTVEMVNEAKRKADAAKEKANAVQEQSADKGVPRKARQEVGLQEVGEGDKGQKGAAGTGKAEVKPRYEARLDENAPGSAPSYYLHDNETGTVAKVRPPSDMTSKSGIQGVADKLNGVSEADALARDNAIRDRRKAEREAAKSEAASKTNQTPEDFHAWVKAQPHVGPRTSAHVLYDRYVQSHPNVTPAEFGQMIHDLPRGEWEILTSPSGASKFSAKDSTGVTRQITGIRRAGVQGPAIDKPAASEPTVKPRVTRSQKIEQLEKADVVEKNGKFYIKHPGGYVLGSKGKPQSFITKALADLHVKYSLDELKKSAALTKKGPQELGTFNPLRALIGDERYEEANKKISDLYQGTRATVNPGGFDVHSRLNARIGRDYLAQRERSAQQRETQLKHVRHAFDRIVARSPGEAVRFMFNVEGGNTHTDLFAQSYGTVFRQMLDDKRTEVQNLGTGALTFYIDNYFPHIWKDPAKASQVLGAGKSPLQGSKAFLKQRTIPTIEEGMFPHGAPANLDTMSMSEIRAEVKRQGGLEPLSYNPAEMVQIKLQEQDRYIFGQKWFAEMKDRGLAKFVRFGAKAPDGYIKIDDKIARVLQKGPTGMILRGDWMAPEGAARIMNNHLTPGIGGHPTMGPAFRVANYVNNSMNMAQLGLSGFHATTTAMNSIISENARAFDLATSGNPKGALKAAVTAPFAPLRDYWQGSKVLQEYRNAGTVGGDIPAIVDSLVKGGGRVALAQEFRLNAMEKFGRAVRQGDVRTMGLNALPAALESTMAPLMRDAVPKMKLGAFAELMRDELQRMGPSPTLEQQRTVASRAWDSIENRFGELNYDNLFWDKSFQDAGHLAVRALGWNLGTVRELGGSALDVKDTGSRLSSGGRVLTPRMAYAMSLVYTTAMAGAIYGYMHGRPPKTLEDYFTPMGPDGKRVQFPTYMKDVRSYATDPLGTIWNKKSPLADLTIETLQNKDFFSKPIRNKEDPIIKQAEEYFGYLGKSMAPFSMRGNKGESAAMGRERMFGITPVSSPKKKPQPRGESVESLMRGPKL